MNLSSFASYPSLRGKSVLVTGGGSGIGAALTEGFARQGAKVAFIDIDRARSQSLADAIDREHSVRPQFLECDLTDIVALERAIADATGAHGPIDVLVNNAARDDRHTWESVDGTYWDAMMATNLKQMFFAIRAIAPAMARRGAGSIINMGSISWKLKNGGYPIYATSKAAVQGLTNSAARDFGKRGVRVNTVVPGWVMTERQLKLWVTPEAEADIDRNQCLPGRIMPVDIAAMVLFLASDDARMCTGQEFIVDAGWA